MISKKMLSKLASVILILCLNQGLVKAMQPVERSVGRLNISIDPRIELLSTIQLLSNYPVVNRNLPYSTEVLSYFEDFSSLEAVTMTSSLLQSYGFSYDAPVTFMLYLSQPPELEPTIMFSDYLLERSGRGDNLEQYRKSIKEFAEKSNFEDFWNSKVPFYNQILDMTISDMGAKDLVKAMEDYFNEAQESYNIVIAPAFIGGYGPKISDADGKEHIYACLSTTNQKDGIPYLSGDNLLYYVWHEFGHSFVNPLTAKYAEKVSSLNQLYEPIRNWMSMQAYGSWETSVNEHIIRAVHIRLMELHICSQQSKAMLENELRNRFIYIEPLIEKLKDFENQRDSKKITFSQYYPELLNVMDSLLKIEYWKQVKTNFSGPINAVSMEQKLAVIYPTQDPNTQALKIVQDYSKLIFGRFFESRGGVLLADTTALQTDLSEYGIITYGTIESNLFLKQHAPTFPFKVENQTIFADKEYTDKDIKLITCVPNPYNPEKGMLIYTALSNRSIQDINNVFHGGEDYILFLNPETIISRGFYNKNEKWTF